MAILVLWAGNGYGVLEHSCEEHGKHQHILTNWIQTSCEHDHHHDAEAHEHESGDSGFHTSHSEEQASFVHFYAETLQKTSVVSAVIIPLFQEASPYSFLSKETVFSSEIHFFPSPTRVFRRTLGRSLLVWVQSFLI